jgi:hypothetical protein
MSDLDKKLEEIVASGQPIARASAEMVLEIKQAFIDAGWVPTVEITSNTTLDAAESKTITEAFNETRCHCGKDGHALNSVNCPVHGGEIMTGQEWYDRFINELPQDVVIDYDSQSNVSFHAGNNHGLYKAREAAKKAAGLDDKEVR